MPAMLAQYRAASVAGHLGKCTQPHHSHGETLANLWCHLDRCSALSCWECKLAGAVRDYGSFRNTVVLYSTVLQYACTVHSGRLSGPADSSPCAQCEIQNPTLKQPVLHQLSGALAKILWVRLFRESHISQASLTVEGGQHPTEPILRPGASLRRGR